MDPADAAALRDLLHRHEVAALGTLHRGEPFVSMVPFAFDVDGFAPLIHVSALAAHTRDLQLAPRVSLMVMARPEAAPSPQALPRATVQGDAATLARDSEAYAAGKARYLARFPQSAPIFDLADFTLVRIEPRSVRYVGGFARAAGLTRAQFVAVMQAGPTPA